MIQLDTVNHTVTVGAAASALALPVRGRRIYAFIHNPSSSAVYLYMTAYDSTNYPGIVLYEHDTFEINPDNPWSGAMFAYCANAISLYTTDVFEKV